MKKALVVARWEFLCTVTRRAYIFAVIAMPVFYGGMFTLAGFAGRSAATTANRTPTAVVDQTRLLDLDFAAEQAALRDRSPQASLVAYHDLDTAVAALGADQVAVVFVIGSDYLTTGSITAYSRNTGIFAQAAARQRQTQLGDAIRASLLKRALSGDELARAYAPAVRVVQMRLTSGGRAEPVSDTTGLGPLAGSFGVFFLLTMAIFFSAGFLQQATVADRQNRVIEILLSSIDARELLLGKILGLGAAGLLQLGIYVGLIIVPGAMVLSLFEVPLGTLAMSMVYFVIGYTLFACLMAGTGMLGRTAQESSQLSVIWTLSASIPWFFIANVSAAPNGLLARSLSFFPLTSAVMMMMRLANGGVPPLDIALSIAIDSAAIYVAFTTAARIFRTASLMQGKRATLPEFLRWLRA